MSSKNSMRITRSATKNMKQQNQMLEYAGIPEDVLFYEILPRLPIKQILGFRSVCRRWYALTNEFKFITNQAHRSIHSSSNQSVFMYPNHDDSLSVISFEEQNRYRLPPPYPLQTRLHSRMLYVGSCNGLVYGYTSCHKLIFVCNPIVCKPITRRTIFVNTFRHKDRIVPPSGVALAFDPPLTPNAGPELMKFKLICPIENETSRQNVFVKGKVYWFNHIFLVWFNVNEEEEVAGTIPLPPPNTTAITDLSLGVCDGELSCCNMTMDSKLNVWLRRGEWVRLHEVSLERIIRANWNVDIAPRDMKLRDCGTVFLRRHLVFTMSYDGGDILMFWMRTEHGRQRIFGFNSKTMELKELSAPDLTQSYIPPFPYKAILLQEPKWI
ncbi:hypothetical protein Scep_027032 [Stephania cephalantha]|uniref:F-box domain-containing protein n=1 Tax=Stephania cephalantha TaxID=152367 RepID=A0AAP0HNP7_9MAGN